MAPDQSRDFDPGGGDFYRQAPWRSVGEGETIEIQCQQLGGGPWYAVILGKMINIKGLMLFDDREGRRLMQRANYDCIADRLRTIAVHFEDAGQADPEDVAAVKQHGLRGRRTRTPIRWRSAWRPGGASASRSPGSWSSWKPASG